MKEIFEFLGVDWTIVMLYICSGLIIKAYLDVDWPVPFTKRTFTTAWKTLFVGTAIVSIYILIEYGDYIAITRKVWKGLFITYIFTTSFYELFLKDTVVDWIVNLFPKPKPKP